MDTPFLSNLPQLACQRSEGETKISVIIVSPRDTTIKTKTVDAKLGNDRKTSLNKTTLNGKCWTFKDDGREDILDDPKN